MTTINYVGEASDNFVTRWAFQSKCQHSYDPNTEKKHYATVEGTGISFDPDNVKPGDYIYMRKPELFFKEMAPLIKNPYVIITNGNFTDSVKEEYYEYLDKYDNIIAWFAIHPAKTPHPKVHPMPQGALQIKEMHDLCKAKNELFKKLRNTPKTVLCQQNFTVSTDPALGTEFGEKPERNEIVELMADKEWCEKLSPSLPWEEYMTARSRAKFALAPRGYGIDSYARLEAAFVSCIPIIKSCQLNIAYKDIPILIVDDWTQITKEFLEEKYIEITSKEWNIEPLYVEYWFDKIETVKKEYFSHN